MNRPRKELKPGEFPRRLCIANAYFHAGDRDHFGLRPGESRQCSSTEGPLWELRDVNTGKAIAAQVGARERPQPPQVVWVPVLWHHEDKPRDLAAARHMLYLGAAIATPTDAELIALADGPRDVFEQTLFGVTLTAEERK